MLKNTEQFEQFSVLMIALLDERITGPQRDQLTALVDADTEARSLYIKYVNMHVELKKHYGVDGEKNIEDPMLVDSNLLFEALEMQQRAQSQRTRELAVEQAKLDEEAVQHGRRQKMLFGLDHEPVQPIRRVVIPKPMFYGAIACIAAMLALLILPMFESKPVVNAPIDDSSVAPSPLFAATLTNTMDERWAKSSSSLAVGDGLVADVMHQLIEGVAELTFSDGTVAIVEAPARFAIRDINKVEMQTGKLVADIGQSSQRFTVQTPTALVVDLGTHFGVKINSDLSTDARVFKGSVILAGLNAVAKKSQKIILDDTGARVAADGKTSTFLPPLTSVEFLRDWGEVEDRVFVSGAARLLRDAPKSMVLGQLTSDRLIYGFRESKNIKISRQVRASFTRPGVFETFLNDDGAALPLDAAVDSYLLHYGPDSYGGLTIDEGVFVFPRPILGVIASHTGLNATDAALGHADIKYNPALPGRSLEGLEITSRQKANPDRVVIDPDGRTLRVRFGVLGSVDQIRVLIASKKLNPEKYER